MKYWVLSWLVLHAVTQENDAQICVAGQVPFSTCAEEFLNISRTGNPTEIIRALWSLDDSMNRPNIDFFSVSGFLGITHFPTTRFDGLEIFANRSQIMIGMPVPNTILKVALPKELDPPWPIIVFCTFTLPTKDIFGDRLYDGRLVGLKVRGKNIFGLQTRMNITMNITDLPITQKLQCVFLNFSTNNFSSNGCLTLWEPGQSHITCSCDHLTLFGVLMVSVSLSPKDQEILEYISLIGCSLSLFGLVITVLLFITNRELRGDDSKKVHIGLVIALILLNTHFLPSQWVATVSSPGLCFYMALSLHYSLLATFSWIALEGFHLYLHFVKVFNIYIKSYLLKVNIVAWGVPAVIVLVVVITDRETYGRVPLDISNPNSTEICYITNDVVKHVTTLGMFGLVFMFNMSMLMVIVRHVLGVCHKKKFGESERGTTRNKICLLLTLITLLGITWGLIFFSFGHLTTPFLYIFCIANSLQGFLIFVYFVLAWKKIRDSATESNTETFNTNNPQK
ncbi:adhesion G-protein coupled receptor G2-like [Odontesthes bonariensis]|uniref:adhesion G-protein coupled receptor G2-like n=1 Tax=Odontesthes bonariensis TaxID=219752 RepID=UPI003F58B626